MKKILLSILGIFFGLSAFCSAIDYTFSPISDPVSFYYNDGTLYSNNITFTWGYTSRVNVNLSSFNMYISGYNGGSLKLTNICFNGWNQYSFDGLFCDEYSFLATGWTHDDNYVWCYSLSGLDLSLSNYSLNNCYGVIGGVRDRIGTTFVNNMSDKVLYSGYFDLPYFDLSFVGGEPYDRRGWYYPVPVLLTFDVQSAPTFTVNYGNQSESYTMDQDVDIYINSPVSKNGNIFTYDGSTGINLFYNNSSEFYVKDKLYLDGYYNFTKGVFNPVCL